MKYQSAPIPVKPYVQRFFENNNVIKDYIFEPLYPLFTSQCGLDKDVSLVEYDHSVVIQLPERVYRNQGPRLTRQGIAIVNCVLEGYIKDRFECELEANCRRSFREKTKFHIQEMVLELRKVFNLSEEEMPFETIKKSLQRHCDKYGIDYQELKNYNLNVPSAMSKTAISCHIKANVFRRKLKIPERTFYRYKKNKIIKCERFGRILYININDLPEWLKLKYDFVSGT